MGLKLIYELEGKEVKLIPLSWQSVTGLIYTLHWLIVMPFVITKMAFTPKKLRWVKTPRQGDG
jgi:1,2-diacylglycerol 3-beta-glucosyltransferase